MALVAVSLAWLVGIALQLQQAALWSPAPYAALLAGALAAGLTAWRWRPVRIAAGVVAALLAGFALTGLRAADRLADTLAPELEGQDLVLTGVVAELPRRTLAGTRFVFEVELARHGSLAVKVPARVSLGWYRGPDDDALVLGPASELRAGQRWRLPVRLRQPHGLANPGGFDLELWMFERHLRAGGSVRSRAAAPAELLGERVAHPVERVRESIRGAVYARVTDPAVAGVIAALAVGDQAAIEREEWELFRTTGVAHLMSISGLHVTMFAWLAGLAIGRLWRFSARAMLAVPAPAAARWGGLAAAAGYALLAGWGVPAQRTLLMIGVVVLLRALAVAWPLPLTLLAAAFAVTLADPWAMLQPGFWLSFVAVAMLIAAEPAQRDRDAPARAHERAVDALRGFSRTQLVATVGLAPLAIVFFQQLSVVGLVANFVAIPLVTLLVTPLALLGVIVAPLWIAVAWLVQGLIEVLRWFAGWPFAVWTAAAAPWWAAAAGLAGAALLVLPLPWRVRALGAPMLLPLLLPAVERPEAGRFELVALDVGQGSAVLVRTANHLLVYDTGPQYSIEADAAQRVLLPVLRARGERRVHHLVLSHRDTDHVGGAATLLAQLPVGSVSSSLGADHPLVAGREGHRPCTAGEGWTWDGVRFEVLHPQGDESAATRANALSCVLRIEGINGRALLTGDIEAAQEQRLVDRAGDRLPSDFLLVPHHGSRTSSTDAFLDAVRPRVAVVQAGYRSRFGHPAREVVQRFEQRGVELIRTDRCGAWTWAPDGSSHCQRDRVRRYWHHPS